MIISKKQVLLASIIIAIYALALNEWNVSLIKKDNPANATKNARSIVHNSAIFCIDNIWYVSQIKNYLNGNGFTVNPKMHNYTVRRTPAYPLFYGLHYSLFGEDKSYFFIRFTQILIYILATFALFFAGFNFTADKRIAFFCAVLFAFSPTLVAFLYYTVTEAVSPSLVCFLLYYLSLCKINNRKRDWFLVGVFFAIGSLCRPTIFFFGGSVFFALIIYSQQIFRKVIINGLFFCLGAGVFFIPYTIRNYIVTKGDFILLEKYYGDPMDYGMPNIELRKWISCWMNPADYSSEIISNNMLSAICCDTTKAKEMVIENEIKRLPVRAFLVNNESAIKEVYNALYDYYQAKTNQASSAKIDSFEKICTLKISFLRRDFIQKAPLQYYIITPLLIVKSVIMQSNSSQLVFLDNYKGNYLKYGLKMILYFLNIYLFMAMIGGLAFIRKYSSIYWIVVLFILSNFIYIIFVIKYFEVRYLIPLFPCLYIAGAIFFVEMGTQIKKRLGFQIFH